MRTLAAQLVRSLPAPSDLRTDGHLLAGFLTLGTEDDFAELVRRHGPLVWGVCCRTLPDHADAEDAFQATFLVLVRRGRKLTSYPTIGPWLHKVAAWTARNVRRRNARRLSRQAPMPDQVPALGRDPDLRLDIDSALLALPEKFRSPIVLCHLLGYSRADAARHLGCAEGTLSAWLSRGLARLRTRFGSLDVTKPLGLVAVTAPGALTTSVVRAAVASRMAVATSVVSLSVSQVVEGVVRMFWIQKATAMAATVFAVFALGVGVGLSGRQVEGVASGQEKGVETKKESKAPPAVGEDIPELEKSLINAEEVLKGSLEGLSAVTRKIDLYRGEHLLTEPILNDLKQLARFQENATKAAASVKELNARLDELRNPERKKAKPEPKGRLEALADIDRHLNNLKLQLKQREWLLKHVENEVAEVKKLQRDIATLTKQREQLEKQKPPEKENPPPKKDGATKSPRDKQWDELFQRLEAERREVEAKRREAEEKLEKMQRDMAAFKRKYREQARNYENSRGRLELLVTFGKLGYEFSLKELDPQGKEIGTLVIEDSPEKERMLTVLLARTKGDFRAPRDLRVVVSPPASSGRGSLAALQSCEAAGYARVTFTGYIVSGGFARNLKPDEKGEVPGYKHYVNEERTPASLIQEIEKGRGSY